MVKLLKWAGCCRPRRTWTFNGICSFECSLLLPYWSRGIWPYARMGPFRDCRTCSIFRSAQAKMFRVKSHIFHLFGSMLVPRKKSKVGIKDRICIVFYCWRIHDSYPQKKKDSWFLNISYVWPDWSTVEGSGLDSRPTELTQERRISDTKIKAKTLGKFLLNRLTSINRKKDR